MSAPANVVVVGGGFAGLETAFSLRQHLADRVKITMVSDRGDFIFKPNTIYLPFGGREDKLHIRLERPLRRRDIPLHVSRVAKVDADQRRVALGDGGELGYDHLVIATGAAMRPTEIPGLADHAQTIWTPEQMHQLGSRLRQLTDDVHRGKRPQVLFLVPPNNKCAGPLYEIVFMLETWLRQRGIRDQVSIEWATFEDGYIQAFGPRLHTLVSGEFAARGIEGHTGAVVSKVLSDHVAFSDGVSRNYDLLVSFPPYVSAVDYPGLPSDGRGFLSTDAATRQVSGQPQIYAPGDAGDFPVKQAFLAFLQADAVADDIAAQIDPGAVKRSRPFEPTSMCVMEMRDKAAFAQVPLSLTGDPAGPLTVDESDPGQYRVGMSRIWRLGKKTLGLYLPWQFGAGRPFHGGRAWQAMELGLRVMASTLASGASR